MKNIIINTLDASQIEIEGEIPSETFDSYHQKAIDKLKKDTTTPGFRKGSTPEKILLDRVGEDTILHLAAEETLKDHYPKIILENKIEAIGRPEITITKLSKGNPLGFKIKTSVLPTFLLPDYKKIAKSITSIKKDPVAVTTKEVDDALANIQHQMEIESLATTEDNLPPKGAPHEKKVIPLDDDLARSLGNFKDLNDLKEKLRINITEEKTRKEKEKQRTLLLEALAKNTPFVVPLILIENEEKRMLADLRFQIERSGLDFSNYLSHINKTEEELKVGWKEEAEKRAKISLIIEKIIKEESITPDSNKVEDEIETIKQLYPSVPPDKVRLYAESVLTYEQVYSLLENPK